MLERPLILIERTVDCFKLLDVNSEGQVKRGANSSERTCISNVRYGSTTPAAKGAETDSKGVSMAPAEPTASTSS